PYAGIKFLAYEQIRALVITNNAQETHFRRFISGSLAGCCSVFFTYPLEVIRVRLAFETKNAGRSSFTNTVRQIYTEHLRPPAPASSATAASPLASAAAALPPRSGVS